jgi:hypothetical protein
MYPLTDDQIDYIHNDLRARGVEREDLQLNLLDHICCVIEHELETGGDFKSFYNELIRRFYRKELREIEDETTLLLTFKHYYAMKKTMIVSGLLTTLGFLAATIFKFNHWPGTNVLFVLGFAMFALLFLPLLFILKMKERPERKNKAILSIGMLLGMTAIISVLFKIMHWPGAFVMMLSALCGLVFLFVPIYFFSGIRNPASKINTIVTTVLLIGGAGMLMSLVSIKPSWYYHNMIIQSDQLLRTELAGMEKVSAALNAKKLVTDSSAAIKLARFQESGDAFTKLSDELIMKMAKEVSAGDGPVNMEEVSVSNDYDIANRVLFANDKTGQSGPIKQLRKQLEELQSRAKEAGVAFEVVNDEAARVDGVKAPWEYSQFYDNAAGIAVRKLILLQLQVKTAELEILAK